jgi:MinD-like ATPase involved in chromosome partitioning or flagellar assembly
MLTAMIFGANPDVVSCVNRMCCEVQDISLYRGLDRYPQAREAMQLLNSYAPQLLFLDIDDEETAMTLELDTRSFNPGTTIVRVSSRLGDRSQQSNGYGTFQVLRLPCDSAKFNATVHRALDAQTCEKNASVFAFLPAKAGSGATTAALFVTNILSRMVHKKVLLLECDLHAGPVSMLYNIRPQYSIMDALEDSHRLSDEMWKRLATSLDGIDVLPSLSQQGVRRVSPWAYHRLLAFARSRYDLIICDLPEVVNEATEVVVRAAKAVLVVTTPALPSLLLAARRRHDLEKRGVGAPNVKYILNRKLDGQTIPRGACDELETGRIADIPVDENLSDMSEFNPNAAKRRTLAECVKIAEFCSGVSIESGAQRRKTNFFFSRWFRAAPVRRSDPSKYATRASTAG